MPCLKWEIKCKKVVLVLESMAKHFPRFLRNYVPASLIWSSDHPSLFSFHLFRLFQKKKKRKAQNQTPCRSPGPVIQTSKPLSVASERTTARWSLLFRIISSICCASGPVCSAAWQRDGRQGRLEMLPFLVARDSTCAFTSFLRPRSLWHQCSCCFHLFIHTSVDGRSTNVLCAHGLPWIWWWYF